MGLRLQRSDPGLKVFLFLILFIATFFTFAVAAGEDSSIVMTITATLPVPDYPTAVLDISMPAEMNTASKVSFPLEVEIGDYNREEGLENDSYVARFFNTGHAQVGEDAVLELKDSCETVEVFRSNGSENGSVLKLNGTVELPGTAEGYYYVFIYRIEDGGENVLPFSCSWDDIRNPCCAGTNLSCLYIYFERATLKPVSGDFLRPGCTADWCCGCLCTDGNIKNRIHLKKPHSTKGSDDNLGKPVIRKPTRPGGKSPGEISGPGETEGEISDRWEVKLVLSGTNPLLLSSSERSSSALLADGGTDFREVVKLRYIVPENLPPAPEGQEFGSTCFEIESVYEELPESARISVMYSEEDLEKVGGDPSKLKLAYLDEVEGKWIPVPTEFDEKEMTLTVYTKQPGNWIVLTGDSEEVVSEAKANSGKSENDAPFSGLVSSRSLLLVLGSLLAALSPFLIWKKQDQKETVAKKAISDISTMVLDVSMPTEMISASKVNIPFRVGIRAFNGEEDEGYAYLARFFNTGHEQVGEDVRLEFENNRTDLVNLSGRAELFGTPEGYYYVFVYRTRGGEERVLPFACSGEEYVNDCCSDRMFSYIYLCEDKNVLKPVSGDFLHPGCSADWCCGCLCTGESIKNMVCLKKPTE